MRIFLLLYLPPDWVFSLMFFIVADFFQFSNCSLFTYWRIAPRKCQKSDKILGRTSVSIYDLQTDPSTTLPDYFAVTISSTLHLEFVDLMVLFIFKNLDFLLTKYETEIMLGTLIWCNFLCSISTLNEFWQQMAHSYDSMFNFQHLK